MKKINIFTVFLTLFFLSVLSISAQKKFVTSVAQKDATYISIKTEDGTKNFLSSGGIQTLTVTTNLVVNLKSSRAWCKPSVDRTTGLLSIEVDANTGNANRTAEVTIYGKDNQSAVVNIIQLGTQQMILVDETSICVDQYTSTFTLSITSNVPFSFELPGWISGPNKTGTVGYSKYTFTLAPITVANTQNNGNIIVKSENQQTSVTIPITQKHVGYPRFAVISDTHFGNSQGEGPMYKVPKALKNITSHGKLDALFVVGDLTNNGKTTEYTQLIQVFSDKNNFINPVDTLMYMLGNHDNYNAQDNYINGLKPLNNGKAYPLDQYLVIKGYPFITISQRNSSNTDATTESNGTGAYPKAVQDTLKSWLAKAAAECPGKPIFVFTHVPPKYTCYSSWPNEGDGTSWPTWSMKTLNPILNNYPQAIVFGGHSHYPIGDPRSIHQGVNPGNSTRNNFFTGINTGSTTYSEIHRPSVSEGIHPDKYNYVTEGLILTVLENGDVKIQRYDTYRNEEILPEKPWVVEAPHDGSKFKYADIRDKDDTNVNGLPVRTGLPAPVFATDAAITLSDITANVVKVTFPQATDDECVFRYKVCIRNGTGTIVKEVFQFSYFYLNSAMPATLSVNIAGLSSQTTYTAEVTAYDSYDNISNKLISEPFTTAADDDDAPENQPPARSGSWLFEDSANLMKASVGNNLIPATTTSKGGVTIENSAADANITSISGPSTENKAVTVPKFSLLKLVHGKTAMVDTYTIMYDVRISATGKFYPLLQTSLLNDNDGDFFINKTNKLGLSTAGWGYGGNVIIDAWHRIVLVVKGGIPTAYLNGLPVSIGTGSNNRWKLEPEATLLFADDNGEDYDIDVAELAFWDTALTAGQVKKLGSVE